MSDTAVRPSMSLVPVDLDGCPARGARLTVMTVAQPALLFHGGYGETTATRTLICPCGWDLEHTVTSEAPARRRRLSPNGTE